MWCQKNGEAPARREAASYLRDSYQVSERRACRALGAGRSSIRYRARRSGDDELRYQLRELATSKPRYGYRRLAILLRRAGELVNAKRVLRVYREEGLAVRRKGRRRLVAAARRPLESLSGPNERWSIDFMSDTWPAAGPFDS